jgi:probable rRNA maturation factor
MDIEVTICQASDVRRPAKKAPLIARGVFLSADDVIRAARRMLKASGVRQAQLSIVFLKGTAMRRLNRRSLGHDYVTDVITFDLGREQGAGSRARRGRRQGQGAAAFFSPCSTLHAPCFIESEICICPAEARRNARLYGEPVEREVLRYVAHGILHLLGHDDGSRADRERMREREEVLLNLLGARHKTQGTRHKKRPIST